LEWDNARVSSAGQSKVLEAAIACIAETGLEGASIRQVAARASVSIGAVQHHYPTKDALLAAAMTYLESSYRERLARSTAAAATSTERLRHTVHALVPDGADDRRATALWVAFVGRSAVHPPTAEEHRRLWQRAEDGLTHLVSAALGEDSPVRSQPARDAAAGLLALADGLSVAALLEPDRMSERRAHRLVDAAVDALLHQHRGPDPPRVNEDPGGCRSTGFGAQA
jgi:AcrR family transcriptional regulator